MDGGHTTYEVFDCWNIRGTAVSRDWEVESAGLLMMGSSITAFAADRDKFHFFPRGSRSHE